MTPMFTKRPIPIGTYEGRGALWSFNGYSRWVPYCAPFNHTGQPAASVPAGFTDDGFPLAVQLVGRPGDEATLALARRPDRGRPAVGGPRPAALIELAEEIARAAGAQLRAAFETELRIETKSSPTDLVSEADVAAEKLIRDRLLAARPDDGMLGEEGSDTRGSSGLRWIVDPLDGTTNFLFGIPQWGVSIAVEDEQGMLAGVVYDPMRDELWAARRGEPPTLDGGRSTAATHASELAEALVATGYGYEADVRAAQAEISGRLLPLVRDIRRMGSRRDRPRVDRRGPLRRLLRARHQDVGLRRRRADLRVRRARGEAPGSGASDGRGDPRRFARARGRARVAGRLIRARPGYPPRHDYRRRHRLLHPAPHPRVPVPASLAAP